MLFHKSSSVRTHSPHQSQLGGKLCDWWFRGITSPLCCPRKGLRWWRIKSQLRHVVSLDTSIFISHHCRHHASFLELLCIANVSSTVNNSTDIVLQNRPLFTSSGGKNSLSPVIRRVLSVHSSTCPLEFVLYYSFQEVPNLLSKFLLTP